MFGSMGRSRKGGWREEPDLEGLWVIFQGLPSVSQALRRPGRTMSRAAAVLEVGRLGRDTGWVAVVMSR